MYPTVDAIESKILDLLPLDGAVVLNRVLLVRIRQAFEAPVSQNDYFRAVNSLEGRHIVGRMRGAGGQVFRLSASAQVRAFPIAEKALMAPTIAYLKSEFIGLLELPEASRAIVIDTSRSGPVKGTWARPDFVLVTSSTYSFMPGRHVDVHSFELKTLSGGSVSSVHEALAQTRFTHFGHFLWHLPRGAKKEDMLPEVMAQCDEHGIGFVRAYEPTDLIAGWEVVKTAKRKPTPVGVVDSFLCERVSDADRAFLLSVAGRGNEL